MDDKPDFLDRGSDIERPAEAPVEPEIDWPAETGAAALAEAETGSKPQITFLGNSYDLTAVVGLTIGAVVLLSCATCNLGYYCLPFVPIILGIIGLVAAKDSVNPDRTKLLSWLSVGSGAAILLLMFVFIALYVGFIVFAIMADSGGF
ncbi:MAG: hypothetical protein AB1801_18860 [Chloroflexota bacterium]